MLPPACLAKQFVGLAINTHRGVFELVTPFLDKLICGGQTGADRAALDWANHNGVPRGGWCPKGRLAEDGPIDAGYGLTETPTISYPGMRKELSLLTMSYIALAVFAATVFSGCESEHHERRDSGYPGPGYEHSTRHDGDRDSNSDREWDRDRR